MEAMILVRQAQSVRTSVITESSYIMSLKTTGKPQSYRQWVRYVKDWVESPSDTPAFGIRR